MTGNLNELKTIDDLDRALEESHKRPVLVFKHSNTCPISTRAFRELESYLSHADSRAGYNLVVVQTSRPVSNEIVARLGIDHESPQAILVNEGQEVWSASHMSITADALGRAIDSVLSR
jgi:monothiol bacilliredoxin